MLYDITIHFDYVYDAAADSGRHLVRMTPADVPGEQRLVAASLSVTPQPHEREERFDFFGNRVTGIAFREPHRKLSFRVQSRVDRPDPGDTLDVSPRLSELRLELDACRSADASSPHHFIARSPRIAADSHVAAYANDQARPGQSVRAVVEAIGKALHADMRYDPDATDVDTTVAEAFALRRGVCQDFTHVMIAGLRSLGIPAAYVSGLLRTEPPPGKPRLAGADAMHAWVRAWCGADMGWVEYDPTNAAFVRGHHVVVARGRDYSDVAPVRGVMRTAGAHRTRQTVDMVPIER